MPQEINGLDVKKLKNTVDLFGKDPEQAKLTLRAHNRWVNGAHCQTTISDFNVGGRELSHKKPVVLDADEPPALLGEDRGPGATEGLLYALASCLNTTLIYHATARGVRVEELELELEGGMDLRGLLGVTDSVRNGFDAIRVTFHIKADVTRDQMEELCNLACRHSPVYDMVTHVTPVHTQVEATEAKPVQKKAA